MSTTIDEKEIVHKAIEGGISALISPTIFVRSAKWHVQRLSDQPPFPMRSAFQALAHFVLGWSTFALPLALLLTSTTSALFTPNNHSLLVTTVTWGVLWVYSVFRVGLFSGLEDGTRKKCSHAAGVLLVLATICERTCGDRHGLWLTKPLLPIAVYASLYVSFSGNAESHSSLDGQSSWNNPFPHHTLRSLVLVAICAGIVLEIPFASAEIITLGLCSVVLFAAALVLIDRAITPAVDDQRWNGPYLSVNSSVGHRDPSPDGFTTAIRDISAVVAVGCGAATLIFETFRKDSDMYHGHNPMLGSNRESDPLEARGSDMVIGLLVELGKACLTISSVYLQGSFRTALIALVAYLCARIRSDFTVFGVWFTTLCIATSLLFIDDPIISLPVIPLSSSGRMRSRHLVSSLAIFSIIVFSLKTLRSPVSSSVPQDGNPALLNYNAPSVPLLPLEVGTNATHPIEQLIKDAEEDFRRVVEHQSQTLEEAVAEYRRRYRIPPPPNFDRWFEFAKRRGVQLIDEYDTIYHSLLPFWALKPSVIRARVRESIGNEDNSLIAVLIREGQTIRVDGGAEWQKEALLGMLKDFVGHLPDMDLAFNIHDEPRVIVPHDRLSRMVALAKDVSMPEAFKNKSPRNSFSPRPQDVGITSRIAEVKTTRFNKFAHQATWSHSRLSCSPDSPARNFDENPKDNLTSYALGRLGFVYNQTAFSDICMSPSLRETFGFFDRPNAFNIVQDLFPIFSASKISSYQDIVYPSPWYWYGKVSYNGEKDMPWDGKANSLFWRGSTTGGFSRNGGWRRQHRQHIVTKLNSLDTAKVLVNRGDKTPDWQLKDVKREDFKEIVDVKFSHVGQCDPGDCDAQKEFFKIAPSVDQQDVWKYKHLLDMDGNAFSGRFYAFLKSKCLVYKMAIFQEWHQDWLKPWLHYIPLSLRGDEWLEIIRYFSAEEQGKTQAPQLAVESRGWATKSLRNEDFEAWFFRLLLEYGRLIDDDREIIGFPGLQ